MFGRSSVFMPIPIGKVIPTVPTGHARVPRLRHAAQRQHAAVRAARGDRRRRAARRSTSSALRHSGCPRQPREYFDGVEDPRVLELLAPTRPAARPSRRRPRAPRPRSSDGTTPNGVFGGKLMWGYLRRPRRARSASCPARTRLRGSRERFAEPALRPRHAPRQGRPGGLAVARGPDPRLARRRRRRATASRSTTSRRSTISSAQLDRRTTTPGRAWFAAQRHRAAARRLRGRSPPTRAAHGPAVLDHLGVVPAEPSPTPPLRRQGDDRSAALGRTATAEEAA